MNAQRPSWKKLSVVALVVAAGGFALLQPETSLETPPTQLAQLVEAERSHQRTGGELPEVHESRRTADVTGDLVHVVDGPADIAMARRNYENRVLDNIEDLEREAAEARAQGFDQRAEIMEKRMVGLERRLAEFDLGRAGG